MSPRGARLGVAALAAAFVCAVGAAPALGDFPYTPQGTPTNAYLGPNDVPNDLGGDGNTFKFAATPDPSNTLINSNPVKLLRDPGAHLADADHSVPTGMRTTLGRPDVSIAVLDSGIKWNDAGAMSDLRRKIRLNTNELPKPDGCAEYDCNNDGAVNVDDYASDPMVLAVLNGPRATTHRNGPDGVLTPEDLIIAFSDGQDGVGSNTESNGFVDDIAGWDFLDDDNDPFDDVQYGHGTGEAHDSSSEANNGDQLGSCPNCMVLPLRVGESFIADVNHFAEAAIYATDNRISVIQEALGTINNSSLARDAVDYAYRHGVTIIASAADEAAQHNNWPSTMAHVIVVNSVRDSVIPPPHQSYLDFNGCTNFSAHITLAIPSTSCSSNATGLAAGMAGLIYSAALTAHDKGALDEFSDASLCQRTNGDHCLVTPNEVKQLMASGTIGSTRQSDDVNFAGTPAGGTEPACTPIALPQCTDPNGPGATTSGLTGALRAQVTANRPVTLPSTISYPARKGFDQFYGYGRVNMVNALKAVLSDPAAANPDDATIPPDVEIDSPHWYEQVDPARSSYTVEGQVFARGANFTCQVYVAPGHYPNNALTNQSPAGDFKPVGSGACDGSSVHSGAIDGPLSTLNLGDLKSRFPVDATGTSFRGRQSGTQGIQSSNGRPDSAPYGFTVKVVATTTQGSTTMTGEDQRAAFLHRDQDMLAHFPRGITRGEIKEEPPTGDGESSPVLADLDGDNTNDLVVAGSDGFIHAIDSTGHELPGWPKRGDPPPLHTDGRAFDSGDISSDVGGAIVSAVAVGDVNRDGVPEVFATDLEGQIYGWHADGTPFFHKQADPKFSGKPLTPFVNERHGKTNRTQHAFFASPVLADLDGDGKQEIVAAAMDRHVYAWHPDGSEVSGFPVLVVDPSKVASVNPTTDEVTFNGNSGAQMQGGIVDTPAVADLDGDGKPEIVLGTNEEYSADQDGGFNSAPANGASFNAVDQAFNTIGQIQSMCPASAKPLCDNIPDSLLSLANSRLYAIHGDGTDHSGGAIVSGWPAKLGIINAELLPDVGEGVVGGPVVGASSCGPGGSGGSGPKIGAMANNGPGYIFDVTGASCYGKVSGKDIPLQSDVSASTSQLDRPLLPAVGNPAFADLDGTGLSLVSPAAGLQRALDLVLPDYQFLSQDFIAAWSVQGLGQVRPNYPQTMNDLQFLTGPAVADIDGLPGQEIVSGSASQDLAAYNALGAPVNTKWPKLTTDWTVTTPTIGSFGTEDTSSSAHKVVVGLTRSGYINAYSTDAPACSPSSSPRFHHDNANSGDFARDAVSPGKPTNLQANGDKTLLTFKAPGDDLLCGSAASYQVVTSSSPIDESNFDPQQGALTGAPPPAAPGQTETYALPAHDQYVAIRAVDEQGNVGRVASIDLGSGGTGCTDLPDHDCVPDPTDNCPTISNPTQVDTDHDGLGDLCDPTPNGTGGGGTGAGTGSSGTSAMSLSVKPRHPRAGHRRRFKFTVSSANPNCIAGVTVKLGKRTAVTDASGRAKIRRRYGHAGKKGATATKQGCGSAAARIKIRA